MVGGDVPGVSGSAPTLLKQTRLKISNLAASTGVRSLEGAADPSEGWLPFPLTSFMVSSQTGRGMNTTSRILVGSPRQDMRLVRTSPIPPLPSPWPTPKNRCAPAPQLWVPWLTAGPSLKGSTWPAVLRRRRPGLVALGGVGSVRRGRSLMPKASAMRRLLRMNLRACSTIFSHLTATPCVGRSW